MPIQHAIWKVSERPVPLPETRLVSESFLEKMIVQDSSILSERWMLIGQQVRTRHGGIIDLLALNADGQLIIIELKKAQTPREVVSQALDYASWAEDLEADEIAAIYNRYSNGASLDDAFQQRFGLPLDEEQLNDTHQIVIVASSLDLSTERIVNYLNSKDFAINVIFFQVFQDGEAQYLSRSWLIDPVETESKAVSASSGPK
ncbi:MAG: endonuclease NucS domain-containing protein, partial [Pseudohongiellaceae bacterium]